MRSRTDPRAAFNDDGTPRRKYEIEPQADAKAPLRIAFALVLANALVLIKNIFFGDDAAKAQPGPQQTATATERGAAGINTAADSASITFSMDSDELPTSKAAPATVPTFEALKFISNGSYLGSSIGPHAPDLRATPGLPGAGNDNVALYRSLPGNAIDLHLDETFRGRPSADNGRGSGSSGEAATIDGIIRSVKAAAQPPQSVDHTPDPVVTPPAGDRPRENRLPNLTGPVFLGTLLSNQTIVLALSDFLEHASDPDGDQLSVSGLSISSGSLDIHADAGLVFITDFGAASELTFNYGVSDGIGETEQIATLDLLPSNGEPITGTAGSDFIIGTPGDDVIDGSARSHIIVGRGGHDNVYGSAGNDRIVMGDGNDVVHAGGGNDVVFAGRGNDVVFGGAGNDVIFGEDGDDILLGEDGNDTISGGAGNDTVDGAIGDDTLTGDDGNDLMLGGDGRDDIDGGANNDIVDGGADNDDVQGGSGDDQVIATKNDGDDKIDGGSGNDTYVASGTSGAMRVNLQHGTIESDDIGHDTVTEIENVKAGSGDDTITGDDDANEITGNAGDDHVETEGGDDTVIATSHDGDDHYDGGSGHDTYDATTTTAAAQVDLIAGTIASDDVGHDTVTEIENVEAGSGDDTITGNDDANEITGNAGDDHVETKGGDDTVIATSHDGDDHYDGGSGHDTYDAATTAAAAQVDLIAGTIASDDVGHDTVTEIENVKAGSGDDTIAGNDDANEITGNAGDDHVETKGGDDTVIATSHDGDDNYDGGSGHDTYDASTTTASLQVNLIAGTITSDDVGDDTVTEIEDVKAGSGDDTIACDDEANEITGNAGDDHVETKGGDDTVIATNHDGDDHYDGGSGRDTYDASTTTAALQVNLITGTINSDDVGHDTVTDIENVCGGSGDDRIVANDMVNILSGGDGNDTFVFGSVEAIGKGSGSRDKILDFDVGDRIDLDNISREFSNIVDQTFADANIRHFVLIGLQEKFAEPGQMKIQYEDVDGVTSTLLMGNINLDEDAEFVLEITGMHDLKSSDFVTHS